MSRLILRVQMRVQQQSGFVVLTKQPLQQFAAVCLQSLCGKMESIYGKWGKKVQIFIHVSLILIN